jgi:hypothetical protein
MAMEATTQINHTMAAQLLPTNHRFQTKRQARLSTATMGTMVTTLMSCSNRRAAISLSGEVTQSMMLLRDHRRGRETVSFDKC